MDLSFSKSNQETLLQNHPKETRIKNLISITFVNSLILIIIISISIIFPSICKKRTRPEQVDAYISGSSRFYCHLTPYPQLCYTSMSSIINATGLQSNPGPIFTTSLQVAINELNKTTYSITKALSSLTDNKTLSGPRLSKCQTLVHDSLSHINDSLRLLGVDMEMEWLTYAEMDNFHGLTMSANKNVVECLLTLEEIMGVEEVKLGVEEANKHIVNSILLFEGRESILSDFYDPPLNHSDYDYDYYFHNFECRFLVCLYSAMYLFLALLYFLFWSSH